MNLNDLESQNSILPKGYMKSNKVKNYNSSNQAHDQPTTKKKEPINDISGVLNSESFSEGRGPNKNNKVESKEAKREQPSAEAELESDSEINGKHEESKHNLLDFGSTK